jgi:hypothetical protein
MKSLAVDGTGKLFLVEVPIPEMVEERRARKKIVIKFQVSLNTLIVNRVDHHFPAAYGDLQNELYEMASWLKLNVLQPIPYKPHMQNAPAAEGGMK